MRFQLYNSIHSVMLSVNIIEWNSNEDWTRQITFFCIPISLAEAYMIISAAYTTHMTMVHWTIYSTRQIM